MWFNSITNRWTTKVEASPSPHPLIGKTFALDNEDPFAGFYCKVIDVRANSKGIEYVKYCFFDELGGRQLTESHSTPLEVFNMVWKEVK